MQDYAPYLTYTVLWDEPEHDATVQLYGQANDQAEIDAVLAAVQRVDEATWRRMLSRCPPPPLRTATTTTPPC